MSAPHTPGPWSEGIDGNPRVYGPDGMGEHSGIVANVFKGRGNVKLIAAAPDLLAALVDTVDLAHTLATMRGCEYEGDIGADLVPARAAIAKATA